MSVDAVMFDTRPSRAGDVVDYSDEVRAAMRLLEPLIQKGLIAVCPDRWIGGRLAFLRPHIAKKQGWSVHVPDLNVDRWALMPVPDQSVEAELVSECRLAEPLVDALDATARMLRDEVDHMISLGMKLGSEYRTTPLHRRLQQHFDELLTAQLKSLTRDA